MFDYLPTRCCSMTGMRVAGRVGAGCRSAVRSRRATPTSGIRTIQGLADSTERVDHRVNLGVGEHAWTGGPKPPVLLHRGALRLRIIDRHHRTRTTPATAVNPIRYIASGVEALGPNHIDIGIDARDRGGDVEESKSVAVVRSSAAEGWGRRMRCAEA